MGQIDPLGFSPRQGARLTREGEVAEADPQQESELGVELAQDLTGDDRLPGRECEVPEQTRRGVDGERGELGDREAGNPHGERGGLEPRAAAGRARRLAPVARQEDAYVELVTIRLDLLEEPLDAGGAPVALVDERARLGGKRLPRRGRVEPVAAQIGRGAWRGR